MDPLEEDREKGERVPGINKRRLAVIGYGGCGRNLIYHLDQVLGIRDDVEVVAFQRRDFDFLDLGNTRKIYWDNRNVDGHRLTMAENFERIDEASIEVEKQISGCDVLIIAAGLGRLTGSYGSIKISQLFSRSRTKVIAFVVTPFHGEGQRRFDPKVCLNDLNRLCDVVVVASNDRLIEVAPKESLNAAFVRTRSLFQQIVKKMLEVDSENGDLVLDDPDGLAEIYINKRSLGEQEGMRLRYDAELEIIRLENCMQIGSMDRELVYREYDEIYAKNDAIMIKLRADLRLVRDFLVDEINKSNAVEEEEIDRQEFYRVIRTLLVSAVDDDQIPYCIPINMSEYRFFVEEVVLHLNVIDVVIERLGSSLSNGPELSQNIKQYVKDYLHGMISILETDPQHMKDEIDKHLPLLHKGLMDELKFRAGVIDTSAFDDDRLLVLNTKYPEKKGEWGNL